MSIVFLMEYDLLYVEVKLVIHIMIRVNCGVTDGSWISYHGLIKYGTHKYVTYVVMS